jgi:hypothetical protein
VALDNIDRRRFFLAAIVSILALPALWWVNRDDSARPNTAAVGVDVGSGASASTSPRAAPVTVVPTIGRSALPPVETVGDQPPIFLDGPASQVGGVSQIAVPDTDSLDSYVVEATYGGDVTGPETCLAKNIPTGQEITVINLDNYRTTTCRVSRAPATQRDDLVLHTDQFVELADLTDAPIPVQIRL